LKKLYAFLFLFGLLTILFGSIIGSGAHKLVHYVNTPATVAPHTSSHGYSHAHDHGHGVHEHSTVLTLLLKSSDYQRLASLLDNFGQALQWVLQLPGIFEDQDTSLNSILPKEVRNSSLYVLGFHTTAQLDIPTPPPRLLGF